MDIITTLRKRLESIGITTTYSLNAPWIYITTINGKPVTERHLANHGFTVAFYPTRLDKVMTLTDRKLIFQTIRTYLE